MISKPFNFYAEHGLVPLDRSQDLPTSMATFQSYQEGVVHPNHFNSPEFENGLFQENGFPSSNYSSSALPHGYIPYSNTTALASLVRNSENPTLISIANPPSATPPPHPHSPLNASISGNASLRPPKKIKCLMQNCNQVMRSDNMIVHLRNVHRERIPQGTRLKDWIHNRTASAV